MKIKWGIIIVLLLSLVLRVYRLGDVPVSLFGDEVDASYHAWSLATTLRDYRGHFLPSYIQSLSEWRAPLEMYVVAPFVGLLGPSTFAARLPMAILGVLSVYLTYLITNLLFPKKISLGKKHELDTGLITAFILALTPWHFHYTRNVVEQPPLFVLILLGVYFYLKACDKAYCYALSLLAFILTFYTYSIANLATPIIVLILLFCIPPKIKEVIKKNTLGLLLITSLAILPIAYQIVLGQAAGRFKFINIANDRSTLDQIVLDRNRPWLESPLLEKVMNNKLTAIGGGFISNYLTSLSPQFLFLDGDPNYRQSVDHFGVFLLALAPFLLIGIYVLVRNIKDRANLFPLLWLLLIPVGSSLTQGGGSHASRLFLMNFPFVVITSVGLARVISLIKEKIRPFVAVAILLVVVVNFSAYFYRYFNHYAYESSHVWQYGYEQLFGRSRDLVANADRVFINNTNEPSLYRFAFYLPIKPGDFQKDFTTDIPTPNLLPGFSGFVFGDKYYFGQADSFEAMINLIQPGDLYFASQRMEVPGDWDLEKSPPSGVKVLLTVRDFYQRPLLYVLGK